MSFKRTPKQRKIKLNAENSKMIAGKMYITELRAIIVKVKDLQEQINWDDKIMHPTLGKMLAYKGKYDRVQYQPKVVVELPEIDESEMIECSKELDHEFANESI